MKKHLFTWIVCSMTVFGQYYGERVTEKSFEESSLFFNSHYLNTFGLRNFRDVSVGLIDDPFLDLYMNPAHLPNLQNKSVLYWDFRSDKSREPLTRYPIPFVDVALFAPPDPRWPTQTRQEAEPFFSFGVLTNPLRNLVKDFYLGGTYQLTHRKERFYSVPNWIYYGRYGYDAFNEAMGTSNVPIIDRYTGTDEMMTTSHAFALYAGYKVVEAVDIGVSLDGIFQSRDGSYGSSYEDPYSSTWQSKSLHSEGRDQDYHHLDLAGGLCYHMSTETAFGIKAGILSGSADQKYHLIDSSRYDYYSGTDWNHSFYQSMTHQTWNHDGNTWYASADWSQKIDDQKSVQFFYRYSMTSADMTNTSTILDTALYASHYSWNTTTYDYMGNSSVRDIRAGTGQDKRYNHQAALNFNYRLTGKSNVLAGINLSINKTIMNSAEPVSASRVSSYIYDSNGYNYKLDEDKTLAWSYRSVHWTIQVPVIVQHEIGEHWNVMVGINRILSDWSIKEQTTAYYTKRTRLENGTTIEETNFGERYREPDKKMTDNRTNIMTSVGVMLSQHFNINLLINPEFEHSFRVAQWWLSFRTTF